MFGFSNILAVGAHPDDIEYSCLGFLLKSQEVSANCTAFVASYGSAGDASSGKNRAIETEKSFKEVNIPVMIQQDSEFRFDILETQIRKLILDKKIDCLLVHDPNDSHQEHRFLYEVSLSAIRRTGVSLIRYKSVSSLVTFTPNFFVDVTRYMPVKELILSNHISQGNKVYMSKETIRAFHTLFQINNSNAQNYYEQYSAERLIF